MWCSVCSVFTYVIGMLFPVQYYRLTMSTILGKRVKELTELLFIRMMEMDAAVHHNKYIFINKNQTLWT